MKLFKLMGCIILIFFLVISVFSATYTVSNTNDSGAGSLRQAIIEANNNSGADTIIFSITGIIQPTSGLPTLDDTSGGTYIYAGLAHNIVLDGTNAGNTNGLTITSGGNTISGLVINQFDLNGIQITGSSAVGNYITGNYIGTDLNGTSDLGNGNNGILLNGGSTSTSIALNLISGNDNLGIYIAGSGTNNNVVIGNLIGTNISGTGSIGNFNQGIRIDTGSQSNRIGGTTDVERNIISSNFAGILIDDNDTDNNHILGNYIGTDINGTSDLGNSTHGIVISNDCQGNTVGGIIAGSGNIISGNTKSGIFLTGSTSNNVILGNHIGTDVNGTADLGNSWSGIEIRGMANNNIVGGTTLSARNIISGNDQHGILITESNTENNVVLGNFIGTDVDGTADLGNTNNGIYINGGAQSNTIGGTVAGSGNVISGNNNIGILISGSGTNYNVIQGNYMGTDVNGTADLGNTNEGIAIWGGAQSNIVGGAVPVARNIISGNNTSGVTLYDSATTDNVIQGNYIGTDVNGTGDLGNDSAGIYIGNGSYANTIGGTITGARNIISGNDHYGIQIMGSNTDNNAVIGNYIGTDVNGTANIGNSWTGIYIFNGAASNTVAKNIIAFNGYDGVWIENDNTIKNRISENSFFGNVQLGIDLGTNGVTPNDVSDSDTGANQLMNFPVLELYTEDQANYIVAGTANPNAEVEIYIVNNSIASVNPDPTGYGEGYEYKTTVTADGTGTFTTTAINLADGTGLSAIAIDGDGNTSEFCFNIFTSSAIIVNTVTITPADLAQEEVKSGTEDVLMGSLTASTNSDTATWSSATFDIIGTCANADVYNVKVYLDTGDGQFSADTDTLIGTGTLTGKQTTIDITDQTIDATDKLYFVTVDLADNAPNNVTVGVRCESGSYFTIEDPDIISGTNFPFQSSLTTIKNYEDTLENMKVYPNPWKPNLGMSYIRFEKLTQNVTIKIYTISGELIMESDADQQSEWNWDLANKNGEKIASGIYLYIVSNNLGEEKQGKLAIIH